MLIGVYTMHSSKGSLCEDEGSNAGSNVSDSGLKQSLKSLMITNTKVPSFFLSMFHSFHSGLDVL